jgi:hypothetical protein
MVNERIATGDRAMHQKEEAVLRAAEAWAAARAEFEWTTEREPASDGIGSAELAIYGAVERAEALRTAERALYDAVKAKALRRAPTSVREPTSHSLPALAVCN